MRLWLNGLGEILGDVLATSKPVYLSGNVWFVNSATGTDAGGTAGQDREKPLATLGQAITNASAGDAVLLESGHSETLTAAVAVSKQLFIIGGGSSGGVPTVKFTMNAAAQDTFTITAANCEIRNILFPESSQTNAGSSGAKVVITNVAGTRLIGCRFEMGAKDNYAGVKWVTAGDNTRIDGCTFISTATVTATRPARGIHTNSLAIADLEVYNSIFSDGTVGFVSGAFDSAGGIVTRLKVVSLSLLLGASFLAHTSSTGFIIGLAQTGGGRVGWP